MYFVPVPLSINLPDTSAHVTDYLTVTNTSFKHRVVIGAMSLLYLSCLSNSILEWYLNGVRPIDIEGTHVVILDPVFPRWTTLFGQINFFSMAFIADVLMVRQFCVILFELRLIISFSKIWRCYNVWNCSVRSILLSSFLVVCESSTSDLVSPTNGSPLTSLFNFK